MSLSSKARELIAVVDDEKRYVKSVSAVLSAKGFDTEVFVDGRDFLDNLTPRFSLVILGVNMPRVDGLTAIPQITQISPDTTIIMTTGTFSIDIALQCIKKGAEDYLLKPIEYDDLLKAINEALIKRKKRIVRREYHEKIEKQLQKLLKDKKDSDKAIKREIHFPPGYHQAGISILNYFSEIISNKYPNIPVKIKIEQDGKTVWMTVTSPEGNEEIIEKALEEYGLVLSNKISPEKFLPEPSQIMALRHKLDIAKLEASHTLLLMASDQQFPDRPEVQ